MIQKMNTKRNIYLKMKTLKEARELLKKQFALSDKLASERLAVPDAVSRILAKPVVAQLSSPHFHAAAMDGVAVKAVNTFGACETSPKELIVGKDAFYLNTGHVMPTNTDAVIMIEHIQAPDDRRIIIEAPVFPWQNVRKMGEDIVATELLFPQNHKVTPYCVGALLTAGVFEVEVRQKPKILIIPTGSELVDWTAMPDDSDFMPQLKPGQVIETNSYVLGKLIEANGGEYERRDYLRDDEAKIRLTVQDAVNSAFDMILILGGSSAGSEDYAKHVLTSLGTILVHGVTIMPGKPVIIGAIEQTPVFGIPGYPVSAIIAFEQFVYPLMCQMLGQTEKKRDLATVTPSKKIASKLGVEEFVRVKLGKVDQKIVATPLPRGAGCITSLTDADGILRIPNNSEGISADETAQAELLRPLQAIDNTIVVVGSHDNTLDVLTDMIKARRPDLTLSSGHVGSLGGLMAIKKGGCHVAGTHLIDTEDGSYNISYIKRYLPDIPVKLVHLVCREQGLIVPAGNPKNIQSFEDLRREDIRLINRQRGSGTRVLLDYRLQELNIDTRDINGYTNEEFTHMSVAVAVLSGASDVGLGVYAAAKALCLDFIPVVTEQYELVIPSCYFETDMIRVLLDTIASSEFKKRVLALGGYHTDRTGELIL